MVEIAGFRDIEKALGRLEKRASDVFERSRRNELNRIDCTAIQAEAAFIRAAAQSIQDTFQATRE